MNSNNKLYLILALVCFLAVGCSNEFLNTPPKDRIVTSNFFKTPNDLKTYTNGFYKMFPSEDLYFRDSKSDNILPFVVAKRITGSRKVPTSSGSGGWSWSNLRKINYFLAHYKHVNNKNAEQRYGALAKFSRAWFYYRKVKRFGDVPWYNKVLQAGDSALYKPRDPRTLVMDSVLADINYAIKYLPEQVELYKITKYTALILKARICLFEGTFRKYHTELNLQSTADKWLKRAADAAHQLIKSGAYTLYTKGGPDESYRNLFARNNQDPIETILARHYVKNTVEQNVASQMTALTHGGWGMTQDMVNTYLMKDGSRFTDQSNYKTMGFYKEMQNRDPRLTQTTAGPNYTNYGESTPAPVNLDMASTGYRIIKALPPKDQWGANSSYNDIIIFRYAEALLIYAEAKAELGPLTQHDLDISINKLRDRVDMPHLKITWANAHPDSYLEHEYPNVSGSNKGVILEIRRERRIELFNEGVRWDDLMRWKDGKKIEQPMVGIYFPGLGAYDFNNDGTPDVYVYDGNRSGAPSGVTSFIDINKRALTNGKSGHLNPFPKGGTFVEPRDYYYPFPKEDIDLNPQLKQNLGWGD
jgi:hypothetical protein